MGAFLFALACGEPTVPVIMHTLMMGVSEFCGFETPRSEFGFVPGTQCPAQFPWDNIVTEDRVPALGEYNEADPEIEPQRAVMMQQAGLDYTIKQVEWGHALTKTRKREPLLNAHCAINHPLSSPVKFAISLWDVMSTGKDRENYWTEAAMTRDEVLASWREYAATVRDQFTTRANYLTVDGRPVLFHGGVHGLAFYARFNISPREITNVIREEIPNAYLVATATAPEFYPHIKEAGFDGFTEYLIYGDSWTQVEARYKEWWEWHLGIAKQYGLDYWVPATVGYDSTAWKSPVASIFLPTPAQFTQHLRDAREFANRNFRWTRGFIITYAWNEFGEGGIIEPMKTGMIRSGNEMSKAHLASLT